MKIARYATAVFVNASVLAACGSGSTHVDGTHLSLQLSSTEPVDGAAPVIEMRAGETRTVVLVAVGAEAPVKFGGRDLPAFAKLDGPILTLAPQRPDGGSYSLTLNADDGHDSANVILHLSVLRFNSAPIWDPAIQMALPNSGLSDDVTGVRYPCPSPKYCTAAPDSWVFFFVCDPEGDGIEAQVEVVPRGQPFQKKATFTASAPAVVPPPQNGNCVNLHVHMPGLVPEQSYDFSVRVRDEFGAVAQVPGAPDGWYVSPELGFDQGPCTKRVCAGGDPGFQCLIDMDCRSGICDKSVAPRFDGFWLCK